MKKTFTCKPSAAAKKRAIKAATATDMINVFEDKLNEFGVESKTSVCSSDEVLARSLAERAVQIFDEDYDEEFKDVGGGFGDPDNIYTLAEIKDYWNRENVYDPILEEYSSYNDWWNDTRSNFLLEL